MWFWLFVIIFVIGIGLIVIGNIDWNYDKHKFLYYNDDGFIIAGCVTSVISGFVALFMLFCIIFSHTNVEAKLEQKREVYNALTYKMESTSCRDEFGFLSKEVIDEVQKWNESIRYYRFVQDDFWNGIFYPNVYDQFKTIDYETYNTGN